MSNFISYKDNKIINIDNVSNIAIDNCSNNKKVIFNLGYSIKVFDGKVTSDYVYWKFDSDIELKEIVNRFLPKIRHWIHPAYDNHHYINPSSISSIKFEDRKYRVIFNLNYSTSIPNNIDKITGDFEFFDFNDYKDYTEFCEYVKDELNIK